MRVWDSLFILFVIAPIAIGGIWLNRPGLHLEYTQPGIAVLILAAWLWGLKKRGLDASKESLVCRLGLKAWDFWCAQLKRNPFRILGLAWIFIAVLWFITAIRRHLAFGSGLADLGIFTNALWNVVPYGFPYSSIKDGLSLLSDHQNFLLYPIGWLFALWPSPIFLLLLQAIGLSSGALALYLLGRQRLGDRHPLLPWLPFAYWMCGPLRAANLFDFHPEVFMLPFFLFAAWLLQESSLRRRFLGVFFLLAALAAKESAGPVTCGLGLAWLLGAGPASTRSFTRPFGAAAIVMGLAAFFVDSQIVPALFGMKYSYSGLYEPFGSSAISLMLAPFRYPLIFFARLFAWSRWKFFSGVLLPFAFLPLLAPAAFVAAVPGFLMLFLTSGEHRLSLGYHYAIEPLVGVLFALPVALDSPLAKKLQRVLLPLFALAALFSYGRSEPFFWRIYQPTDHQVWLRDKVLPAINNDRSVSASYGLVAHLATRHWVNQLPVLVDDKKNPVECVLVETTVNNTPMNSYDFDSLNTALAANHYQREFHCGSFTLYRPQNGFNCLNFPLPECPGAI